MTNTAKLEAKRFLEQPIDVNADQVEDFGPKLV